MADDAVRAQLEQSFTYHAPSGDQPERYVVLRDAAKTLALLTVEHVRPSRERSLAITKLEEYVMWANKGIAING